MKAKYLIKLSLIIDKMEIKNEIVGLETDDNEELAKKIMGLFISNLYKAEKEIYELIADYKGITTEEAEDIDVIAFGKELLKENNIKDFLSIA